jgi:hypothetical protein
MQIFSLLFGELSWRICSKNQWYIDISCGTYDIDPCYIWKWHMVRLDIIFGWKVIPLTALRAFDDMNVVPWDLRNRWSNCLNLGLTLRWSHIFREGNACGDKLAHLGHNCTQMRWWNSLPTTLQDDFLRDKLGLPQYCITWLCNSTCSFGVRPHPLCNYFIFLFIIIQATDRGWEQCGVPT